MKVLSLMVVLICTSISASAQEKTPLQLAMRVMAQNAKLIFQTLDVAGERENNIERSLAIVEAIEVSSKELPSTITKLPEPDRTKAIQRYQGLLERLNKLAKRLTEEITKSEVDKAKKTLDDMIQVRNIGHRQFKPD